jgi:arylsulfatase A-like enzyme
MIMKFRLLPLALASLTALSLFPASAAAADAKKPNILLIYVDDMGYGQLGCYGNKEIPTPNIDALAASGVRMTQGYVSAPLCSPSRAGVMSGHYQERFAHDDNANVDDHPIPYPTLAERMKAIGYDAVMVGKWHLGTVPGQRPLERGFSQFFGTLDNPGSYFTPRLFIDSRVSPEPFKMTKPGFYTTNAYTDWACDYIKQSHDKPWFFYLAYNAVHSPYDATPELLARFSNITDKKRRAFTALFAGLDDGIGRVMQALKDTGQDKNTLIFFISDNGSPYRDAGMNGPLHGYKQEMWEGGFRVPYMVVWKGKIPAGGTYDKPVMNLDVMPTIVTAGGGKVDPAWGLDGVDLLPYLTGSNTGRPHETIDWRMNGKWAARVGDLKLVHEVGKGNPPNNNPPNLFDLSSDTGEKNDLAPSQPDKVKELKDQWNQWNSQMAPPPTSKKGKKGKKTDDEG